MLSEKKIKQLLEDKSIQINVSFEWNGDELIFHKQPLALLSSPEVDNLYSDRLKLTMGPIIRVLNNRAVSKKYRYKNFKECFDLRKSGNIYVIHPGESIILLTNEFINLNGKYACIVVPRISLSDVGIVVSTAYVDPYYNGLMRLHLTNMSDKPYELRSLEAIAQCFFFELSDLVPIKYKNDFSAKSVFYGQTWQQIIQTDRNPFPTKKESVANTMFDTFKYQVDLGIAFVKKHNLIVLFIMNFALIFSGYMNFKREVQTIEQIREWLDPQTCEIIINAGDSEGQKSVNLDCPKADIISVLTNNDNIHYEILSGNSRGESILMFSYGLESPVSYEYEISFSYVIVTRERR